MTILETIQFCLSVYKRLRRFQYLFVILGTAIIVSGCQALAPGMTITTRCHNQYVESKPLGGVPIIEITPELVCELSSCREQWCVYDTLSHEVDPEYRVGPRDHLLIKIWGHPELNHPSQSDIPTDAMSYIVNNQGRIYFPYLGEIEVGDKTVDEIRRQLIEELKSLVKEPVVTVQMMEYRSQSINVVGEVNLPALIPLDDVPLTPLDAVGKAGGATPLGDLQHLVLSRDGCFHELNVLPSFRFGGLSSIYLKHGDIIYVPSRINNQVYVLGEVILPQAIYFDTDELTLSDAIARTLGLDPFASNPNLVFVFREESNGEKVAYHLDATSPAALLLANQFCLKRQDIIYVGPYRPALLNRIMTNFLSTSRVIVDLARTADHINDIIDGYRDFDSGGYNYNQ